MWPAFSVREKSCGVRAENWKWERFGVGDGSVGESARVMERRQREIIVYCCSKCDAGDASLSAHRGLCDGGQVGFSLRACLRKHGTRSLWTQRRAEVQDLGNTLRILHLPPFTWKHLVFYSTDCHLVEFHCLRNQSIRRTIESRNCGNDVMKSSA